jgi:hypothetical protein
VGTAQGGERAWQEHCASRRVRTQARGRGRRWRPVRHSQRRVDLVERERGVPENRPARRRQLHPGPVPPEDRPAQRRFQRRDLPGHRGLGVAQRGRGGRERTALGHLAEHPHPDHRRIHDQYAYHVCEVFLFGMVCAA